MNTAFYESLIASDCLSLTQEEKDQKIQNATEYYKSTTKAKPGSIAAKAQMVQQYNEKHAKKK